MKSNKPRLIRFLIPVALSAILIGIAGYGTITIFPDVGAQGANFLRVILGNQAVATLETIVFRVQDQVETIRFRTGLVKMDTPWDTSPIDEIEADKLQKVDPVPPTSTPAPQEATPTPQIEMVAQPKIDITATPFSSPTPAATPTPSKWILTPLKPIGTLQGEGVWSEYISNASGQVLAYRTFLQPDPERPYAVVGIVAFNLKKTRLNFVLGTDEPYGGGPRRPGKIPDDDLAPNRLLATFNGGFQATHGQYGAMSDGIVALPLKEGIGTIAIWKTGSIDIGAWGKHFRESNEMVAFRQNCPLVIEDGAVNPLVNQNRVQDWGGTVDGHIVTWRSAVAINRERTVLYYIAGSKLNMPIMAKTLLAIGAHQAVQLDINESWVHFVAVRAKEKNLTVEPLFTQGMTFRPDRYLTPYSRDFFYVTARD